MHWGTSLSINSLTYKWRYLPSLYNNNYYYYTERVYIITFILKNLLIEFQRHVIWVSHLHVSIFYIIFSSFHLIWEGDRPPSLLKNSTQILIHQLATLYRVVHFTGDSLWKPSSPTKWRQSVTHWFKWWRRFSSKLLTAALVHNEVL